MILRAVLIVALLPAMTVAEGQDSWIPLFNGKDLAGWTAFARAKKDAPTRPIEPKESWSVADGGVLTCTGQPIGYLATEKEYENYVLRLKWRYPSGATTGNSGVLLHCQSGNRVWPSSLEAQLRAGRAGDVWLQPDEAGKLPTLEVDPARRDPADKTMRHILRDPKAGDVEKPAGEWNEYEITCRGGDVTIVVNGKKVVEGKNGSLTKGRIALQSEGTEIQFKEIAIKPIR